MKIFHLFLILIFFSLTSNLLNPAHSHARKIARISGNVTELSTGKPIEYANVFLSGTTLGDVTDKEGRYIINKIPPGSYVIVISFMGYETAYKSIQIFSEEKKL